MTIRKAEAKDADNIKVLVDSLAHFYLTDEQPEIPSWFAHTLQQSEFERRILSTDFELYVYELDNEVVGYISVKNRTHLYHLFVAKEHQGKGISTMLWQYVNDNLAMEIQSVRSSLFAIPIYHHFGFRKIGLPESKGGISFQTMEIRR